MTRHDVEERDDGWTVVDQITRLPISRSIPPLRSRLEAQALADFRNSMTKPTVESVRPRLQQLRLVWKALVGANR